MVHLIIRFAKCKIIFSILSTSFENFIGIKHVWPQLQPPRHLEVKLKIYAISLIWCHERQNWKKMHSFSLRNYSNNIMDFFKTQILNWKMSWDKKIFSKDSNFDTKIQKHWNQIRRIHNNFVCKFWIWPPIVLEAVAEAILAWSQWNFQNLKVRY